MPAYDDTLSARSSRCWTYRACTWNCSRFLIVAALGLGLLAALQPMRGADSQPDGAQFDEPLRHLAEARTALQAVRDYSCVLIKRERINGVLTPNNVITLKVRNQPFAVYMHWLSPEDMAGREVCYVPGKNGNKMRVRTNGGLGLLGWLTIDPKDPRVLKTTHHSIAEAGLANLIERYAASWETERSRGQARVQIANYEYNKRPCTRIEVVHPVNTAGKYAYFRSVVYFDKESKLPVRVECYDYPRNPSDPGDLVEVFSYVNLRVNVGLGDETFNH